MALPKLERRAHLQLVGGVGGIHQNRRVAPRSCELQLPLGGDAEHEVLTSADVDVLEGEEIRRFAPCQLRLFKLNVHPDTLALCPNPEQRETLAFCNLVYSALILNLIQATIEPLNLAKSRYIQSMQGLTSSSWNLMLLTRCLALMFMTSELETAQSRA